MKQAICFLIFLICLLSVTAGAVELPAPVCTAAFADHQNFGSLDSEDMDRLNALSLGEDTVIAVIDTGVDDTGSIFSNSLYENKNEVPNDGIDNDKNGYIDDYHGWNFGDGNEDILDLNGHGTMVASLVLALAPESKIMPIKVSQKDEDYFSSLKAALAVNYAVKAGADIINMSFVTPYLDFSLKQSLNLAVNQGVVLVGAAGNSGQAVEYPAAMDGVIAVGSSDLQNNPSWFSPKGKTLDLLAPGEALKTAGLGGAESYVSGTSFSAALVSAAAGVLISMNPYLEPKSIRNILINGTKDILDPGFDVSSGHGVFDGKTIYEYAVPGVFSLFPLWKGNPASLAVHLPPIDTKAEIIIGYRREQQIYWLQSNGDFINDQDTPAPVSFIAYEQKAQSLDTVLFGAGGVFDPIDTTNAAPGPYQWGVVIRDLKGNMLGPAGITEMVLQN